MSSSPFWGSFAVFEVLQSRATGENIPSTPLFSPEPVSASPKRSVILDISMSMESRSSSIGLSTELPKDESMGGIGGSSSTVRSISTWCDEELAANAAMRSISVCAEGLADFGARDTGEGKLWENRAASSADIRSEDEDRSSLRGNGGRCKDDREIVDPRRVGFAAPWGDV